MNWKHLFWIVPLAFMAGMLMYSILVTYGSFSLEEMATSCLLQGLDLQCGCVK